VNRFHAAGGTAFVFRELLDAGLLHDVPTIVSGGLRAYTREPRFDVGALRYVEGAPSSGDAAVVRGVADPFEATGGLRLLDGNLGHALVKVSAVKPEYRSIDAPAVVFDDPAELRARHKAGTLPRDFVAVLRHQGPRANGMPEQHSLMPLLGMLQNQGRRVALVTDGRLSGASGKVLSAIHVTPEAAIGGALARLREGDRIVIDTAQGRLYAAVDAAAWERRVPAANTAPSGDDLGRALFAVNRAVAGAADEGALSISCGAPTRAGGADGQPHESEYDVGQVAAAVPTEAKDA
jgi:phosphogluconate dehydratase